MLLGLCQRKEEMKYRAAVLIKNGVVDEEFITYISYYMRMPEKDWNYKVTSQQGKDSLMGGGQWWFVEVETED